MHRPPHDGLHPPYAVCGFFLFAGRGSPLVSLFSEKGIEGRLGRNYTIRKKQAVSVCAALRGNRPYIGRMAKNFRADLALKK